MPGGKSSFLEAAILDHTLGDTPYTAPANVWIALSTAPFDPNATGAALDEVTGGSYARVELTNDVTSFPDAAGSDPAAKQIGVDVNFPTATADWGTILSGYIVDAATVGNVLYGADAVAPFPVASGSSPVIPADTWTVSEQ